MAQKSGPISQGTDEERQFDDVLWRDLFGDEPGVVGDLDGSAYAVTLPGGSDIVSVGSSTQLSTARVAGFSHRIPEDSPEQITIPAATGSARTDIIALRYDPSYTGLPGPVRLVRIAGSSAGLPAYDAAPPGVEDLPLWGITRQPGQALAQAAVKQLFPRLAPSLDVPIGAPLPLSSPLGTRVRQGGTEYRRALDTGGAPVWQVVNATTTFIAGDFFQTTIGGADNTEYGVAEVSIPDLGYACKYEVFGQVLVAASAGTVATLRVRLDTDHGTKIGQNVPRPNGLADEAFVLNVPGFETGALTGAHKVVVTVQRTFGGGSWTVPKLGNYLRVVVRPA